MLEQVIYAALDCHVFELATICIYQLAMDFPGSLRVMRYNAALLEAEEKFVQILIAI